MLTCSMDVHFTYIYIHRLELHAGVFDVGWDAATVSSWSQLCTAGLFWHLDTRHRLHCLHDLSSQYSSAAKQLEQKACKQPSELPGMNELAQAKPSTYCIAENQTSLCMCFCCITATSRIESLDHIVFPQLYVAWHVCSSNSQPWACTFAAT